MSKMLKKTDILQFLRFCVVGTSNAVIDFAVLNVLLWRYPTGNNLRVLDYNSLAVLFAATNSFFWNKYWTFQQRHPITCQEVLRFIVVTGATIIMNDLLMLFLSMMFPDLIRSTLIGANAIKLVAIVGTMSISFFGMRLWVFFHRGHTDATKANILTTSLVTASIDISNMPTMKLRRQQVMKTVKTVIIIPTYNEIENLPLLLNGIFSYAPETNVLIVDDNSPDGTGRLADKMCKNDGRIHVMHRPGKLGLGTAYIAGFKYAIQQGYDAAFEMDADFSHDPRYLPDFLKALEQADLVIGSRYIPGGNTPNWSFLRRLISGSGNIFARFMLGIPVHDCTGGFRCYRRQVLQQINLDDVQSRGYAFQIELTYRVLKQSFKIVEIPITFMDRRLGKSKMSRKIVIEAFTFVLRARFNSKMFDTKLASRAKPAPEFSKQSEIDTTFSTVNPDTYSSISLLSLPNTPIPLNLKVAMSNEQLYEKDSSTMTHIPGKIFSTSSQPQLKTPHGLRPIKLEQLGLFNAANAPITNVTELQQLTWQQSQAWEQQVEQS